MSSLATLHRLLERSPRGSMRSEGGTAELLTLQRRAPDRMFDVSEGGAGVVSEAPLPRGTLVLALIRLPRTNRAFDVFVRVAWVDGQAMGLEFILPDDALMDAVRDHLHPQDSR